MNIVQRRLVHLLNFVFDENFTLQESDLINEELDELLKEAQAQGVETFLFPLYNKQIISLSNESYSIWRNKVFQKILKQKAVLSFMKEIIQLFNQKSIRLMIIKGFVLKDLYRYPDLRTMGDVDLLVKRDDISQAVELLLSLGYTHHCEGATTRHHTMVHAQYPMIDLHYTVFDDDILTRAQSFEDDIWLETLTVVRDDIYYEVPSHQNHLVFLILHTAAHLINSGFGLRQLCDIVILTKHINESSKLDEIVTRMDKYGIKKYGLAIFKTCNKLFEVQLFDNNLLGKEIEDVKIENLINIIFKAGLFGKKDDTYRKITPYAKYVVVKKSKFKYFIMLKSILFPQMVVMKQEYKSLNKYGWLIPVAWTHRIVKRLKLRDFRNEKNLKEIEIKNGLLIDFELIR